LSPWITSAPIKTAVVVSPDRRRRVAGDAETHHGHQSRPTDGVVAGLGTGHPFQGSLAELLGRLRKTLGQEISEERGWASAQPRKGAQQGAAGARPQVGRPVAPILGEGHARSHLADGHCFPRLVGLDATDDDLGDREQADQQGQDVHAGLEVMDPEGEAAGAVNGILTDHRDQEPETGRNQSLEQGFAGHPGNDGDRKDNHREDLRGTEFQGEGGHHREDHQGHDGRQNARREGGVKRHFQGLAGLALAG
jgi:hypothetical protein